MSKRKKHKKRREEERENIQMNSNGYNMNNMNGMNNMNPNMVDNSGMSNNMNSNNMNNNGMGNNMNPNGMNNNVNNNGINNNMYNGNAMNSNMMQGNNMFQNLLMNNPIGSLLQNLAQNPLIQILANIDFNLLSKMLSGNKNKEANVEDPKVKENFTDILKDLNESDIEGLIRKVDPEEINSIMKKLNINVNSNDNNTKDNNINKEFFDLKDEPEEFINNSDYKEHSYKDDSVVDLGERTYNAAIILNIVNKLLRQEDQAFLEKVIKLYKEDEKEEVLKFEEDNNEEEKIKPKEDSKKIKSLEHVDAEEVQEEENNKLVNPVQEVLLNNEKRIKKRENYKGEFIAISISNKKFSQK